MGSRGGNEELQLRVILRQALSIGRARFWDVTVPAIVIFVPLTVLDTYAEYTAQAHTNESTPTGAFVEALSLAGMSGLLLGWVVYAGLLDFVVRAHQHGRPRVPLRRQLRHLPYVRLIEANIIVTLLVVLGIGFLVVPGLLALTLFGIVGPLIVIERRGVVSALGRSVRLVVQHLGLAFVVIAIPFLAEQVIEDLMLDVWNSSLWAAMLISIGLALLVGVSVSLVEVVLAHGLISRDAAERAAAAAGAPA